MRKQAGKQKKTAAAAAAVSAPKPNGGSKAGKTRRNASTLAAPLADDMPDRSAAVTAAADAGVSGRTASSAKRAGPSREKKNKKNTKANSGRNANGNGISSNQPDDVSVGSGQDTRHISDGVTESAQVASGRPALAKSEILQADTYVHVKSEILQAEYLEKLKQQQLLQQQEREQQQEELQQQLLLQQQQQHAQSSEYEGVESTLTPHLNHHHQHLQQQDQQQQQQQTLYHYHEHGSVLVESIQVSAPPGPSLVHNIQTSLPTESSPSQQRPNSVSEIEQGRSPLPLQHHQQQQQQQDHQYPPLALTSQQQQQYQSYQHHDSFPQQGHHQQQSNIQRHPHHQHQHQDLMHAGAPLENEPKDSPPPLIMPESSYVSTTSHPGLMSGSTTTHLIQNEGHDETGNLVYAHQHQQDHEHQQHIHPHHQLLYEAAMHHQRNDGNISDLHVQAQLQPPLAHSRSSSGDGSSLHHGLGNPHNRISTVQIPASSLAGLGGHQASGDIQGMQSASPGPNQMPTMDHQQMAQQLAEMAHPHQTFTMLTNVSSLAGSPSPGIGNNKRGGRPSHIW